MIHRAVPSDPKQVFDEAGDIRVEISKWRCADIDANGENIFVVGDVHGCASLLSALLDMLDRVQVKDGLPRRLVFLGDLISRGPNAVSVLRRWGREAQ